MKKLLAFIAIFGALTFGVSPVFAQDENPYGAEIAQSQSDSIPEEVQGEAEKVGEVIQDAAESMDVAVNTAGEDLGDLADEGSKEVLSFHQEVKRLFIEGGANFMALVLICLILGLSLAIERIIYLNMATTNTKKLLEKIDEALNRGGVDAAKEVCRNTRGPVASIFYQGLDRSTGKIEDVAKSIEDSGAVEMGKLERGLSWISLFIALAPMLGFMGTVIGMITAFDKIAEANTINASIVAGGIKVALITTVSGLVVAIILQIFYNYILSKIDSIVLDMEESSMDLVDMLYKRNFQGK